MFVIEFETTYHEHERTHLLMIKWTNGMHARDVIPQKNIKSIQYYTLFITMSPIVLSLRNYGISLSVFTVKFYKNISPLSLSRGRIACQSHLQARCVRIFGFSWVRLDSLIHVSTCLSGPPHMSKVKVLKLGITSICIYSCVCV